MNTDTLKIATYNIQLSLNVEKITKNIFDMSQRGVSIFCLQEVMRQPEGPFIKDELLRVLGKDWEMECFFGEGEVHNALGTGLLWNTKIIQSQSIAKIVVPIIKPFLPHELVFQILLGGPVHPVTRRITSGVFVWKNNQIRITSVHLDHIGGRFHRNKQLKYILDVLNQQKDTLYEIICGDFNTFDLLHTGEEKKLLQTTLGQHFIDATENIPWTADLYNNDMKKSVLFFKAFVKRTNLHIRRKLDYIWVRNLKVVNSQDLKLSGSDHYPLVAELRIDDKS